MPLILKRLFKTTLLLFVLSLPVIGWWQRWAIYDAWRLQGYTPPAEIAKFATDDTMNDKTRRLYYANHPELEGREEFSTDCRSAEKTIVLGCYIPGRGIFLFKITDPRLDGVMQVTAAHETLHAAYDRLSGSEKAKVVKMIDDFRPKITNTRILDTLENYKKSGADINNELHSILGTEVRDLTPELEEYYAKYFSNRKAVVGFSEKYEQVFSERKQKIAQYDARLEDLKNQINSLEAELKADENYLTMERNRLESLLANGERESYNAGVRGFNASINAYNRKVGLIRSLIEQFNTIVAERNAIATEENELVKALDSRPSTLQAQ